MTNNKNIDKKMSSISSNFYVVAEMYFKKVLYSTSKKCFLGNSCTALEKSMGNSISFVWCLLWVSVSLDNSKSSVFSFFFGQTFSCCHTWLLVLKGWSQNEHENGLLFSWIVVMWIFRFPLWLNILSQCGHLYSIFECMFLVWWYNNFSFL